MENTDISFPDEIIAPGRFFEGASRQVSVNVYERNQHARQQCIEHYGCRCSVCGFDFQAVYGELGSGFIHVHHLKQLSEVTEEYEIDPVADLRPICPNCHAMVHRGPEMLTIESLKKLVGRLQP
jgi:5-methylcytosine-specific restriction protein A